jgi:hypothetical protein
LGKLVISDEEKKRDRRFYYICGTSISVAESFESSKKNGIPPIQRAWPTVRKAENQQSPLQNSPFERSVVIFWNMLMSRGIAI